MKIWLKTVMVLGGMAAVTTGAVASDTTAWLRANEANQSNNQASETQETPLAIGGYDPTLYFAGGLPKPGNATITYVFEGQTYRFATYQSRQTFIENPTHYAPQYGGHCAFAMSEDSTVQANPAVFAVQDDKLFLFENEMKLEMWKNNSRKFRVLADKRWEFEAKNFSRVKAKF